MSGPLPAWRVEAHPRLASTQEHLKERLLAGEDVDGRVIRAAAQGAGRGRRGRTWSSPEGGSYQSFALLDRWGGALRRGGLTLLIAVELAEALKGAGAHTTIKWPNDLYLGGGKLGGILSEYVRDHLIVGIGLNVANPVPEGAAALRGWDLPFVNELVLDAAAAAVAAAAAGESALAELPRRLAPFDLLAGRPVTVDTGAGALEGEGAGVDADGALLLEVGGSVRRVQLGTVVSWEPTEG